MSRVAVLTMLACCWGAGWAYSTGPPDSVCASMTPGHGVGDTTSLGSSYTVTTSANQYSPGSKITVTISGNGATKFRGFMIQIRPLGGTNAVGSITTTAANERSACSGAAATHNSNTDKASVSVDWTAPSTSVGNVQIWATIVQTQPVWTTTKGPIINAATPVTTTLTTIPTTTAITTTPRTAATTTTTTTTPATSTTTTITHTSASTTATTASTTTVATTAPTTTTTTTPSATTTFTTTTITPAATKTAATTASTTTATTIVPTTTITTATMTPATSTTTTTITPTTTKTAATTWSTTTVATTTPTTTTTTTHTTAATATTTTTSATTTTTTTTAATTTMAATTATATKTTATTATAATAATTAADTTPAITTTPTAPTTTTAANIVSTTMAASTVSAASTTTATTPAAAITSATTTPVTIINTTITNATAPPTSPTSSTTPPTTNSMKHIVVSACGNTKSCFKSNVTCDSDCEYLLTWETVGDEIDFEMSGITNGYIAVAFSMDRQMGEDNVIVCTNRGTVSNYYQSDKSGPDLIDQSNPQFGLLSFSGGSDGPGRVSCSFSRKKTFDDARKKRAGDATLVFDLANSFYLFLARGSIDSIGNVEMHVNIPAVSAKQADFSSKNQLFAGEEDYSPPDSTMTVNTATPTETSTAASAAASFFTVALINLILIMFLKAG